MFMVCKVHKVLISVDCSYGSYMLKWSELNEIFFSILYAKENIDVVTLVGYTIYFSDTTRFNRQTDMAHSTTLLIIHDPEDLRSRGK